jgi:CRISPR-associated protein Csb2
MSNQHLCITIRFVQAFPLFHGRGDADRPEWPPSPMRAFQAILNAAGLRARGRPLAPEVRQALNALEILRPQIIAPPASVSSVGHRAYVPHNQYDLVFAALCRGMEPSTEAFRKLNGSVRVEKDFHPMRVESIGDDLPAIHYLYPLDATTLDPDELLRAIRPSVRAITHLGWGIDQVVADAKLIDPAALQLSAERWLPSARTGRRLRVHRKGSLDALTKRHSRFLNRLQDGWTPVPPLTDDDVDHVHYRRDVDPLPRPHVIFKLVDENDDTFRYPHAKLIHIAGMVRHLAIDAMRAEIGGRPWITDDWICRVVRGKWNKEAGDDHQQFSYVPLPSIGHAHADAMIRNVMIVAPLGMDRELYHLADRLDGLELKSESDPEKRDADSAPNLTKRIWLQRFTPPPRKFIAECYLGTANVWETVTPVILDGCNRKSKNDKPEAVARRSEKLICKALARGGIEAPCEFTWQSMPFTKNALSAHKYDREGRRTGYFRPVYLQGYTAVHVRIRFGRRQVTDDPKSAWTPAFVPGPIALGAGRHCGLGVFAAITYP